MIKRILIGLGILVVLVIAALLIVPSFVPVDTYKPRIEAAVQQATGRSFKIKGPIHFTIFPSLSLEANDVGFGNVPGSKHAEMATLKQVVFELKLMPLLHGAIEVDRFVLVQPAIYLEVDKSGRPNWVFAKAAESAPAKPAPGKAAPAPAQSSQGGGFLAGRQLSLGEVKLEDGQIAYQDDRTGTSYLVSKIAMTVKLPDLESPFSLDGQLDWNNQTIKVSAKGKALGRLLANEGGPLTLAVDSKPISVSFDGHVSKVQPVSLDGNVKLSVPSVRDLAAWAGQPIKAGGPGFGPLSIEGKLSMAGNRIAFADAAIAVDDMKGKGQVTLDTGGARPHVVASLDLDKLDLNQYMGEGEAGSAAAKPESKPSGAKSPPSATPALSSTKAPPGEWSDDPIDLAPLKLADADFKFSVGSILMKKLKIDQSRLEMVLKDGLLTADLSELNLYKGKGQGQLVVDGRGAVPTIKAAMKLDGVEAEPLLKDATGNDRLSGKGAMQFNGTATGRSQRALVSALNGNGNIAFHDGAIKGINLAAMVRNVSSSEEKTDFSSLTGSYTIANGILTNKDLEMIAPLLRVKGAGTCDLPKRTVDYRITPKVVASTQGQGGKFAKAGIVVPVIVTGRWDDLHYQPDVAGALEQNAEGAVKGLIQGVKPGGSPGGNVPNPGSLLKNLFGK